MSELHSFHLWLTGPLALTLSRIGLALVGGTLIMDSNPSVNLAARAVTAFALLVLGAHFLSALGAVS